MVVEKNLLIKGFEIDINYDEEFLDYAKQFAIKFNIYDPFFFQKMKAVRYVYNLVSSVELQYLNVLKNRPIEKPSLLAMLSTFGWANAGLLWSEVFLYSLDAVFGNQLSKEFKDNYCLEDFIYFRAVYDVMKERTYPELLPEIYLDKLNNQRILPLSELEATTNKDKTNKLMAVELSSIALYSYLYFLSVSSQINYIFPMFFEYFKNNPNPALFFYDFELVTQLMSASFALLNNNFNMLPAETKATACTVISADAYWYPVWLIDIPKQFDSIKNASPSDRRTYFDETKQFITAIQSFC